MKSRSRLLHLATALFLAARVLAQISDTSPPKLVEFEISPTVVDVSTNDQTIILTARITDDLSGFGSSGPFSSFFSFADVRFHAPGSDSFTQVLGARIFPDFRLSGNAFDGVYRTELTVPVRSHAGTWTVGGFGLGDQTRNVTNLTANDLRGLGLPISFTVTCADEDRSPPEIVSLSLEPTTVDTSTSNCVITITAHIREDVSWAGGFDDLGRPIPAPGAIQFQSPSKRQRAGANILQQISGDGHDGVFRVMLNMPRFSEPGVWRLLTLRLNDRVGNVQSIDLGAALAKGLAAEFTVTGAGDTSPPTLRAFDFFPRRIDAPITNQSVTVTARYADDLGGFFSFDDFGRVVPIIASLQFRSPSWLQSVSAPLYPDSAQFGPLDVVSTNSLEFLQFCETGVWTLTTLSLRDALGNVTQLDAAALRQLGYPTEIAVGITPTITIALQQDSILLSWPAWGDGFHLQSRGVDASAWTTVRTQPATIGDQLVVSIPTPPVSRFFRLSQ